MTHMPIDDTTYAVEIGIDAEEEALGVIGGRVITWKRLTIYVYELADGHMVTGLSAPRVGTQGDPDVGRAIARRNALNRLIKMRENLANSIRPLSTSRAASFPNGGSQ